MKNILLIAFTLFTFILSAQSGNPQRKGKKEIAEKTKDWTPEQRAQLSTKKMTLDLNLTEAQEKKVGIINLEMMKDREKMRATKAKKSDLSSNELFELQHARLEKKIKTKEQFRSILTAEQFDLWEKKYPKNQKIKRPKGSRSK